jgi:hypothetical protein
MMPQVSVGTFTGTGAAQNISLGFVPDYIRIVNMTDGTVTYDWFAGQAAATSTVKTNGAGGPATLAANGVTSYAGSAVPGSEAAPGFSVGSDFANTKVYRYSAFRNGPGKN